MRNALKQHLTRAADAGNKLYRCEKGAEGLEKLLIIGAIVIPLLAVLIFFRDALSTWVKDSWQDVKSDSEIDDPGF